jgi:pimeloyl-ACP methyl ester carboxylesterase
MTMSVLSATVTARSPDCGHFLQEERPEETFEELQHFVGMVRSKRRVARALPLHTRLSA